MDRLPGGERSRCGVYLAEDDDAKLEFDALDCWKSSGGASGADPSVSDLLPLPFDSEVRISVRLGTPHLDPWLDDLSLVCIKP